MEDLSITTLLDNCPSIAKVYKYSNMLDDDLSVHINVIVRKNVYVILLVILFGNYLRTYWLTKETIILFGKSIKVEQLRRVSRKIGEKKK